MLVSAKKIYQYYKQKGGAVGAFNTYNLETTKAIAVAAEKMKKPAIIQISEHAGKTIGLKNLIAIVEVIAKQVKVPITYHLDHGKDISFIKEAIRLGFPSVMFDGSKLPFKKNVQLTKKIVDYAKYFNVWVEGEIGKIASGKQSETSYTDTCEAVEFARLTKVNSLAVAIGNIHGIPVRTEIKLNFDLLKRLATVVKIPLVLHGGSGTKDSEIKKAIKFGIAKVNINSELKKAYIEATENFIEHRSSNDMYEFAEMTQISVQKLVEKKIKLFSK